jgi:hypothetical protein
MRMQRRVTLSSLAVRFQDVTEILYVINGDFSGAKVTLTQHVVVGGGDDDGDGDDEAFHYNNCNSCLK